MDDIVLQAMAKWPNVPDCYGWLGLDARGDWYMRDANAQLHSSFADACAKGEGQAPGKGSKLSHEKLIAFICRNYQPDAHGCWYFQNGPQRVYVELQHTPWVLRVDLCGRVQTHTGEVTVGHEVLTDEAGYVYLLTDKGIGLVHTLDVQIVAQHLESGRWVARATAASELPAKYSYVTSPAARHDAAKHGDIK